MPIQTIQLSRDGADYIINNHLNGNGVFQFAYEAGLTLAQTVLIDWINVMAYAGYDLDVQYIEDYTKAPKRYKPTSWSTYFLVQSKWDHPINEAVPTAAVAIGMKGTKGMNDFS